MSTSGAGVVPANPAPPPIQNASIDLGPPAVLVDGTGVAPAPPIQKASGERADLEAGMAKFFATEAAQDNALDCMRIHGGYGYSLEYRPERYYRDAPLLLIGEGSNEIQQLIIARRLLELHKI